jgi:PhnB protein
MTTHAIVSAIPAGYSSVTPYLIVHDAKAALGFYQSAFSAKVEVQLEMPNGSVGHAEIRVGSAVIMLGQETTEGGQVFKSPLTLGGTACSIMLYVQDCEATFAAAIAAGGTVLEPLVLKFYGDKAGRIQDPFGHQWTIATHVEDVTPSELESRMAALYN